MCALRFSGVRPQYIVFAFSKNRNFGCMKQRYQDLTPSELATLKKIASEMWNGQKYFDHAAREVAQKIPVSLTWAKNFLRGYDGRFEKTANEFRNPHGFAIVDQHLNVIARGKDYDRLQTRVDKHNEESNDRWFVVDESDLKEMSKRNPKPKSFIAIVTADTGKLLTGGVRQRKSSRFATWELARDWAQAVYDTDKDKVRDISIKEVARKPEVNPSTEFKQAIADERERTQAELDALEALENPKINPQSKRTLQKEYEARYGIKGKFTKDDALGVIEVYGIDLNSDFHALRGDDVNTLYDLAILTGYRYADRTGKSYTNAFFDSIGRYAKRRNPRGKARRNAFTNDLEGAKNAWVYGYSVTEAERAGHTLRNLTRAARELIKDGHEFQKRQVTDLKSLGFSSYRFVGQKRNASYSEVDFFDDKAIDQLSAEFQGSISGETLEAVAADSTPKSLARLGHLRKIIVGDFEINFDDTEDAWLAADRRKNLYFVGKDARLSSGQKPRKGQLKHLGKVSQVNYVTEKAHIENGSTTEYFHEFGEVDGVQPDLFVDHDNMLVLVGGNYDIWTCGIVN